MTRRMLVHDRRLEGNPPRIAQNTFQVGFKYHTAAIIDWVRTYARSQGGLEELIIMCHGLSTHSDNVAGQTSSRVVGTAGLLLGRENLDLRNVGLTRSWRGSISRIYLYACSPAMSATNHDPMVDGRRFCGELALHSGATVYAADSVQMYSQLRTRWDTIVNRNHAGTIDFGPWEGTVYAFSPADGRASVMPSPGRHRP